MPAPANQNCSNCRFFFNINQARADYGECRRYPPNNGHRELDLAFSTGAQLPASLSHHSWTICDKAGWCGEYQVLPA